MLQTNGFRGGIKPEGLPRFWREETADALQSLARVVLLDVSQLHESTREDDLWNANGILPLITCPADKLNDQLPWLNKFYRGWLHAKVQDIVGSNAVPSDELSGALVVGAGMRFETHADVHTFGANLYVQGPAHGGLLAVSPDTSARSYREVVRSAMKNPAQNLCAPLTGTVSVVYLNAFPHTITTVGQPNINTEAHNIQSHWPLPDLSDPALWMTARLSLNFNYDDVDNLPTPEDALAVKEHTYGV